MTKDSPISGCAGCRDGSALVFDISMAFQPIFDAETAVPWAYEALVRGVDGAGAEEVLGRVSEDNRYAFDQRCRVVAIEKAVAAGILKTGAKLSINFLPNAVYSPKACIRLTVATAAANAFPLDRLMFEFTENEQIGDPDHVRGIVETYSAMGLGTAIDDFGAGFAGLNLLAAFRTDVVKLDMELIRGLDRSMPRRMIVESVIGLCHRMGMLVVAEGIETEGELAVVRELGVDLLQGYLLARPAFERLPALDYDMTDEEPSRRAVA